MEPEIRNARIERTQLGIEDHGIMTFYLMLDYGGAGQGAGGYALDKPVNPHTLDFRREGTGMGLTLIMRVLSTVGVDNWEDLKGKHIRVKCDYGKVHAIGHFLEDNWLDFEEFFAPYRDKVSA